MNRLGGWSRNMPPVTRNLLLINVIVFLAEKLFMLKGVDLVNLLGMHYIGADSFRIYQLVTYMFLHDPQVFAHIFFNMFALFMFGIMLERVWGTKRFLIFYFFTGIGAGLTQQLVWYFALQGTPHAPMLMELLVTIGASGAIFGILLAFGMLFPNIPLYIIFIPIPIKAKYLVIGYAVIELFSGISGIPGNNVANFAHLGGMIFGLILILLWRKKYGKEVYY